MRMPAVVSMQVYDQVQLSVSVQISCPDDLKVRFVSRSVPERTFSPSPLPYTYHFIITPPLLLPLSTLPHPPPHSPPILHLPNPPPSPFDAFVERRDRHPLTTAARRIAQVSVHCRNIGVGEAYPVVPRGSNTGTSGRSVASTFCTAPVDMESAPSEAPA